MNKGMVFLVGAGPGDPGLLTLRGKELLETAEVLVYDRLASREFLELVPAGCEKIYVGKESGRHSRTQEEINGILVEWALKGKRVIRLKGGDPFVFGRGGEEIQSLFAHGIPYEVVPGVTSAIAALSHAGIPVTHRGVGQSFHVITGHTAVGAGDGDSSSEALTSTPAFRGPHFSWVSNLKRSWKIL
ncbi:MAG: uroporphyrinogen-III C-methyltransferase [Enterocloster sp.]